ncbi:MAG: site-specific integrase [Ruminococcus sp.]|nr:site-specific integrase [Ruminococcus sp.]
MAKKVKRTKTKHANIYFNENTKKYDAKYNYKVYNPLKKKNDYKQKWAYGSATIAEAKKALAELQSQGVKNEDKDITLQGAFELWENKAKAQNYSPVTISNTKQHCSMIYQFLSKETKIKDITDDVYYKLTAQLREHNYSEETLHSLNATFRKLINLCHKKRLVKENVLDYCDNIKTKSKEDYRVITKEEFDEIDVYFKTHSFKRRGVDNYPKYRFLFNLLYYTGIRIGEALALTYEDFEEFSYYKKCEPKEIRLVPSSDDTKKKHLQGTRVKITKAYVSDIKLTKDPKNFKKRSIPVAPAPERLYMRLKEIHRMNDKNMQDRIFSWSHGACDTMLKKACKECGLPPYHCHEFRHTFISNLIAKSVPLPVIEKVSGDTQATILKRYSHMFESDETMVLIAMEDL